MGMFRLPSALLLGLFICILFEPGRATKRPPTVKTPLDDFEDKAYEDYATVADDTEVTPVPRDEWVGPAPDDDFEDNINRGKRGSGGRGGQPNRPGRRASPPRPQPDSTLSTVWNCESKGQKMECKFEKSLQAPGYTAGYNNMEKDDAGGSDGEKEDTGGSGVGNEDTGGSDVELDGTIGTDINADSCLNIPAGFSPIRTGSKYVYKNPWMAESSTLEKMEAACKASGLILPNTAHSADYKSIQDFFREKGRGEYPSLNFLLTPTGMKFDRNKHELLTSDGTTPFLLWAPGEPSNSNDDWITLVDRKYQDKWYLAAVDSRKDEIGYFRLICQFPMDSKCFKNSNEEKQFQANPNVDARLVSVTQGSHPIYLVMGPRSITAAEKYCAHYDYSLSMGRLKSDVREDVRKGYQESLKKLDYFPGAPFFAYGEGSAKGEKGTWSPDGQPVKVQLEGSVHMDDNVPYVPICIKKRTCADEAPGFKLIKPNSKYVYADSWESPTSNSVKAAKDECEKVGLMLPMTSHNQDLWSLQNFFRQMLPANPPEFLLTPTDIRFNTANHMLEGSDGSTPFFFWEPAEPNNEDAYWVTLNRRKFEDKYYLTGVDTKFENDPITLRLMCQFKKESPCFKDSVEEKANKLEPGFDSELISLIKGNRDFYLISGPKMYSSAVEACKSHGLTLFLGLPEFVEDEAHHLREAYFFFFREHDYYPLAPFWAQFANGKDGGVPQKGEWTPPSKPAGFDFAKTTAHKSENTLYTAICQREDKRRSACKKPPAGFKTIRPHSKYVYKDPWERKSSSVEKMEKECKDGGFILPNTAHSADYKSIQDFFREKGRGNFESSPYLLTATGMKFDSKKHQLVTSDGTTPFILWEREEPNTETAIYITFVDRKYDDKWYLVSVDSSKDESQTFRIMCQYPNDSPCFTESVEERAFEDNGKVDSRLLPLVKGENDRAYSLISGPKSIISAKEMCKAKGASLWMGDPEPNADMADKLRKAYQNVLRKNDFYPGTPFFAQHWNGKGDNRPQKGVWSPDGKPAEVQFKGYSHMDDNTPYLPICLAADPDPCLRQPEGFKSIRKNSKYLYRDHSFYTNGTYKQMEAECKKAGLILPITSDTTDWKSIQDFFREMRREKPEISHSHAPLVLTAMGMRFNENTDKLVTSDGSKPFLLWYNTDPNSNKELGVAVTDILHENKPYMAALDTADHAPWTYRLLCQFPKKSPCFLRSVEEKNHKNDDKEIFPLVKGDRNFYLAWPRGLSAARDICDDNGLALWLGNPEVVKIDGTTLRDAYLDTLKENDLYPGAPFFTQFADGKEEAQPGKGNWTDRLKKGKINWVGGAHRVDSNPYMVICHEGSGRLCPKDDPRLDLYRLGESRFYVIQKEQRNALVVKYPEAEPLCESVGLKLAKLPDLTTNTMVSQLLEDFMSSRPSWVNTFWWIDAVFNREAENYLWSNDTAEPLDFHNIYYYHPKPNGFGGLVYGTEGKWVTSGPIEPFCLAIAMARRGRETGTNVLGTVTAWWERACGQTTDTSVLCESPNVVCDLKKPYPENNYNDHYSGLWPMSNRRFIVSYLPQSYGEAETLCASYNLQVYTPSRIDSLCLLPLLKQFVPFKVYHFWTDIEYNAVTKEFKYENGTSVPTYLKNLTLSITGRYNYVEQKKACSAMYWTLENPEQNKDLCNCWSDGFELTGENCNDNIGTICQHPDFAQRKCEKPVRIERPGPNINGFINFNQMSNQFLRSTYRVPLGTGKCPKGYRVVTKTDAYYGRVEDYKGTEYLYDFDAEYSIQGDGKDCFVSTVRFDEETQKLVPEVSKFRCKGIQPKQAFFLCRLEDFRRSVSKG